MVFDVKQVMRPRMPVSAAELERVLERHELYLERRPGGQRALLAYRDLSGCDLRRKNLSEADLSATFLIGTKLLDANLTGAILFGSNLSRADLRNAILVRADLRGAVLRGADLTGADLFDADLRDGRLAVMTRSGDLRDVAIQESALIDSMSRPLAAGAEPYEVISYARDPHTDFTGAVMRSCNLTGADLRRVRLAGADLEGANLSGADLYAANLHDVIPTRPVAAPANADGAEFDSALAEAPAAAPVARTADSLDFLLSEHERWARSNGHEGRQLDASGWDLRQAPPLTGADLAGIEAREAIFCGLNLNNIGLQAAQLAGADLRCCSLMGADLRGVNLKFANLANADLRDCRLGPLALPGNRRVVSRLDRADLRRADLRGADLGHAVFARADLSAADCRETRITGIDLEGATLAGTLGLG